MDRFTMAQLTSASSTPLCVPGSIGEFGSGAGDTVIAKYVKLAYYTPALLRIGEPLWALTGQTDYTDPWVPYLVSPDVGIAADGPTGRISIAASTYTSVHSMVGVGVVATTYAAGNLWVWALMRGPVNNARMVTATNSAAGKLLMPEDVTGSPYGGALKVATAVTDFICGWQTGALTTPGTTDYPYAIDAFISMPRWW